MFSAQNKLDNIIAIIDYNKMQSFGKTKDIIDLDPLKKNLWHLTGKFTKLMAIIFLN